MPLWLGILLAVVSASVAFFAGIRFGSAERHLNRLLAKETRHPWVKPSVASDAAEEGRTDA